MQRLKNKRTLFVVLYFLIYCIAGITLVLKQPYSNPPDESARFVIPMYIARNLKIPTGFEEELLIPSYGFSYASRPILPYMIQAIPIYFAGFFTDSQEVFLYCARFTNFFFGLLMAYFVLKLGEKWFADRRLSAVFSCLVTFLPQALFLHTYVNTDSCCMLSIAIILYALQLCFEDHFSPKSCVLLSVGIIFCAMSYYNAYGYILCAILLFTAYHIRRIGAQIVFDWKSFLKKGMFISCIVLLGAAWWFVRNGILRNGDFLALKELNELILDESVHFSGYYEQTGRSVFDMLRESDFILLSLNSFIAVFGPMSILGNVFLYSFYKRFFLCSLLLQFLFYIKIFFSPRAEAFSLFARNDLTKPPFFRFFWHINMKLCILIPLLLSIHYSYHSDYQPQGRYLLPALIPLCYYTAAGLEKGFRFVENLLQKKTGLRLYRSNSKSDPEKNHGGRTWFTTCCCAVLCLIFAFLLLNTIYGYALPAFASIPS